MKGFIHIESTDREDALRCEASLSDVSKVDRYQLLDAACRLLSLDNQDLAFFFAVRSAGVFDPGFAQVNGAGVALGDTDELLRQYREMKKEEDSSSES